MSARAGPRFDVSAVVLFLAASAPSLSPRATIAQAPEQPPFKAGVEAASSTQLAHIYDQSGGFQFANEYLLLYRSLEKPKQQVDVAIRVKGYGLVLKDSYTTPALGMVSVKPFLERSTWSKVLTSWWFMILVVFLAIWLLSWGVWTMLDARRRTLRARMERFFVALEAAGRRTVPRAAFRAVRHLRSVTRVARLDSSVASPSGAELSREFEASPGSLLLGVLMLGGLVLATSSSAAWSIAFLVVIPSPDHRCSSTSPCS